MAGYGLMNAVQAFQQGTEFRQRQEDWDKEQKKLAVTEEADKAAAAVIEASKAEWAMNGAQGTYQPNDNTMLKAAQARGEVLARGGDWGGYLKNEASVQAQRLRVRAGALQQYEQDGDFEKLARTVDPTMANGKEIVGSERLGGMPSLASIGREATPTKYRFKFSDGSENEVDPEAMVKKLKMSLIDPVKAAEREVELNFQLMKTRIETDGKAEVERVKGGEARLTEGVKQKGAEKLEDRKAGHRLNLADVEGGYRLGVADKAAGATLGAARIRAGAQTDAAETAAGASRYSADKRVEAAKVGKEARGAETKIRDFKAVHDEVTRVVGEKSDQILGGGGRISNEDTQNIARYAKALIDQEDADPGDAIARGIEEWKKRRATKPGGRK